MKYDTEDLIIEIVEDTPAAAEPAAENTPEAQETRPEETAKTVSGEEEAPVIPQEPEEAPEEVPAAEPAPEPPAGPKETEPPAEEPETSAPEKPAASDTKPVEEPSPEDVIKAEEIPAAEPEAEPVIRQQLTEKKPVHITEAGRLPLSLAIETDGGLVSRIAQIGDVLPVKCTREFSTRSNGIKAVALNLYAGERPVAAQNKKIARLKISGIEKLPAGRPVITVNFEIDRDCSIRVEALDEGSLRGVSKTIDSSWKPSDEEIYEIVKDAQSNLAEDNKIRERSRLLRNARECLFRGEQLLKTGRNSLSREQSREIKGKCKRLVQRLKKQNVLDMTELNEKAITDAVNSLDSALRQANSAE